MAPTMAPMGPATTVPSPAPAIAPPRPPTAPAVPVPGPSVVFALRARMSLSNSCVSRSGWLASGSGARSSWRVMVPPVDHNVYRMRPVRNSGTAEVRCAAVTDCGTAAHRMRNTVADPEIPRKNPKKRCGVALGHPAPSRWACPSGRRECGVRDRRGASRELAKTLLDLRAARARLRRRGLEIDAVAVERVGIRLQTVEVQLAHDDARVVTGEVTSQAG